MSAEPPPPDDLAAVAADLAGLEARLARAAAEGDEAWDRVRRCAADLLSAAEAQVSALSPDNPGWAEVRRLRGLVEGDARDTGREASAPVSALALGLEAAQDASRRMAGKSSEIEAELGQSLADVEAMLALARAEMEAVGDEVHERARSLVELLGSECHPQVVEAARGLRDRVDAAREALAAAYPPTRTPSRPEEASPVAASPVNALLEDMANVASSLNEFGQTARSLAAEGQTGLAGERDWLARGGRDSIARVRTILKELADVDEVLRRRGFGEL